MHTIMVPDCQYLAVYELAIKIFLGLEYIFGQDNRRVAVEV